MVEQCKSGPASPVVKQMPTNNFSKNILQATVGIERANLALQSVSMATIPRQGSNIAAGGRSLSMAGGLQKAQSANDFDNMFKG